MAWKAGMWAQCISEDADWRDMYGNPSPGPKPREIVRVCKVDRGEWRGEILKGLHFDEYPIPGHLCGFDARLFRPLVSTGIETLLRIAARPDVPVREEA